MKKIFIVILGIVLLIVGGWLFINYSMGNLNREDIVLQETYDISKDYLSLRYRTDKLLTNAKEYSDYSSWDKDMNILIQDWENLGRQSQELEGSAVKIADTIAVNFHIVKTANAYSTKEINNIYDKAPKFKGIATLAKHLGVDAKRVQMILDQAQAETSSEVFIEEGDAFENLENTAIVVKDGCKVAGFVGTVVLTGGAAGGFAAAGTLTQVGTVIVGADLALEVTEDSAQIAFGDRNKISSLVKDVRTVTEPIASVITITSIPGNLGSAYGKFDSVMVGLEQFRESAQEGKIIGVDLRNFEYQKPFQRIRQAKYPSTVTVAEMEKAEVEDWLKSLNKEYKPMTQEEVEEFLKSSAKKIEQEKEIVKEETKTEEAQDKKVATESKADNTNQIIKVVNVSSNSFMMDTCFTSTCWDDLDADPREDRDLGGIYTMGKVFANGESFKTGFRPADLKASGKLIETSPSNSYKITLYFAIAPFEGPKNKTIEYGTWLSESVEITANYGDEPVIEWDGSTLKQKK